VIAILALAVDIERSERSGDQLTFLRARFEISLARRTSLGLVLFPLGRLGVLAVVALAQRFLVVLGGGFLGIVRGLQSGQCRQCQEDAETAKQKPAEHDLNLSRQSCTHPA
jgi:hypothetical protein